MLGHNLDVTVRKIPRDDRPVITFKRGSTNQLTLSLREWAHLYAYIKKVNEKVHKRFRKPLDPAQAEEEANLWKGKPSMDPELLKIQPELQSVNDVVSENLDKFINDIYPGIVLQNDVTVRDKLMIYLDYKLNAVLCGEEMRVVVKSSDRETEVHFVEYGPVTAKLVTLLHLSFDEWVELYKHTIHINELMWYQEPPSYLTEKA